VTPVSLFISYSHKDIDWLERISEQLAPLENQGLIEVWDDRDIRAASESKWEEQLRPKLEQAGIIVLLLSASFSASRYIQRVELPLALERKRSGKARVYFVLARSYAIEPAILDYQVLPSEKQAISGLADPDAAFAEIVKQIRAELSAPQATRESQPATSTHSVSDYLPFLCDRTLHEAPFVRYLAGRPRRPVAAIVPGPKLESHEGFHVRLAHFSSPSSVTFRRLEWPQEATEIVLSYGIAFALGLQTFDPASINKLLPEGLTLFTVMAPCDEWSSAQLKVLKALLAYWNAWPDLASNRSLCVCVSIPWTMKGPSQGALLKALPQSDYPGLLLTVTPELDSPTKDHASVWLTLPKVRTAYHSDCYVRLNTRVDEIFRGRNGIPMSHLHRDLLQVLKDHPPNPHDHAA
jgi:hypothetical protein